MDKSLKYLHSPLKSIIEPPIDGTINELPIEKLNWEDFEKLCLRMVEIDHSIGNCEIYGIKGQKQNGIDIFAKTESGKYSNYQCKRYQVVNESDLEDAVNVFRTGQWYSVSNKFTFCTSASLNKTQEQNKFNVLKDELKKQGISFIKWDKTQICRILKKYPQIVADFFGNEWAIRFNGSIKISSIEQSIIINNRDGSTNKLISVSEYLNYNPEAFLDYNDYLKQIKLKYYSRGQFLNDTKQLNPDFITERKILDQLISEDYVACIISGEGGIGKTRLMFEVAKRAEKIYNYQTYIIEQNIQSVEDVFSQLKPEYKYLFVFDYIEENELFDQFIDKAAKKHFHVKILGNCRNTHQWKERYFISKHYLNNENTFERRYQRKVTQEIMRPIWVNFLNNENKKFYKTKPSFAVFLRFLFDKNLSENDITSFPDFETWLIRRFSLSLKDEKIEEESIKSILLLPIIENNTDENIEVSIRSFKRKHAFLTKLIEDGWLQEIENSIGTKRLDTVHDTIKDELFLYILNDCKKKSVLIDKLIETIEFAQVEKLEINWFRSLERISDSYTFKVFNDFFIEFFDEVLKELDLLTEKSIFHISKTHLLTETQRFECIVKNPKPFLKFSSNQSFGLPLQNAMNYFFKAKKNENLQTPAVLKILSDEWLKRNNKFTDDGYLADRFISTYINLYSINDLIQPYFSQFILNKFTEFGGFSICSWLEQGGNKTEVEDYLIIFLKQNAKEIDTQFVFSAWLNSGGDNSVVESYVIDFLKQNAKEIDTQYVFSAWLNSGGDNSLVESYVIDFLKQYAKEITSRFVFSAWLNSSGEITVIEGYLIDFLKQNIKEQETSFVIEAWLNNGGEITLIEGYVIDFLKHNVKEIASRFVFSAWLNSSGELTVIEGYLIDFLKQNIKEQETSFVIEAWLNNGGEITLIEGYVIDFLKQNAKNIASRFIFSAWINSGGEITVIESYLIDFLKQNAKEKETSFVIQAWLNSGGENTMVESYVIDFLKQNAKDLVSRFVFSAWINSGGEITVIESYLIDFLKKNVKEKETSFVIQAWLEYGGNKSVVKSYLIDYLKQNAKEKEASYVIQAWLEHGGNKSVIKSYLIKFLKQNVKEKEASYVIQAWLNGITKVDLITEFIYEYLSFHNDKIYTSFVLRSLIQNPSFDSDIIKPFLKKWLDKNLSNSNSKYLLFTWLKKARDNNFMEVYIRMWLDIFPEEEFASKIIEQWINNGGDYNRIIK